MMVAKKVSLHGVLARDGNPPLRFRCLSIYEENGKTKRASDVRIGFHCVHKGSGCSGRRTSGQISILFLC